MQETIRMLITGAGRGIGRAIAERLAQPGRTIILHGRDRKALEETASLVERKEGEAEMVLADIGSIDGVDKIVSHIGEGPLHALIHNAGVAHVEPIEKVTLEHWESTLAVNITAPFLLTQKLLGVMPSGRLLSPTGPVTV
jgi:3-oxoacyl-[acyl-carrier protein] reductase